MGIPEMHPEKLGAGGSPTKSPTESGQAGQAGGTGAAPTPRRRARGRKQDGDMKSPLQGQEGKMAT